MKTDQDIVCLEARIKLLKRQLSEWKLMLANQKQVRRLLKEEFNQPQIIHPNNKLATIERLTKEGARLTQLHERQNQDRQQMRVYHKQEEADLEQAINTHN